MSAPLRTKALAIYREGRMQLLRVECRKTAHEVDEIIARVRSSRDGGPAYAVDLIDGVWTCTCSAGHGCAHVAAVQLATGHASAAG